MYVYIYIYTYIYIYIYLYMYVCIYYIHTNCKCVLHHMYFYIYIKHLHCTHLVILCAKYRTHIARLRYIYGLHIKQLRLLHINEICIPRIFICIPRIFIFFFYSFLTCIQAQDSFQHDDMLPVVRYIFQKYLLLIYIYTCGEDSYTYATLL